MRMNIVEQIWIDCVLLSVFFRVYGGFEMHFNRFMIDHVMNQNKNRVFNIILC